MNTVSADDREARDLRESRDEERGAGDEQQRQRRGADAPVPGAGSPAAGLRPPPRPCRARSRAPCHREAQRQDQIGLHSADEQLGQHARLRRSPPGSPRGLRREDPCAALRPRSLAGSDSVQEPRSSDTAPAGSIPRAPSGLPTGLSPPARATPSASPRVQAVPQAHLLVALPRALASARGGGVAPGWAAASRAGTHRAPSTGSSCRPLWS